MAKSTGSLFSIWTLLAAITIALILYFVFSSSRPLPSNSSQSTSPATTNQSSTTIDSSLGFPLSLPSAYSLSLFATDINDARDLQISPGNTLLVSSPAQGIVFALPDGDQNGFFDQAKPVITGLTHPHGLAFYQNQLYVAEESQVSRFSWDESTLTASLDQVIVKLPAGGRHFTRSLDFDQDGNLYVSIGSTCDTCFEEDPWLGTIIVTDADGNSPQVFASGLRNAVFVKVNSDTNDVWVTEMGRDFLGNDTPPDEINLLSQGQDYGWPVCYGNQVYDQDFGQRNPDYCQQTQPPVFAIPAHSAPLGLTFINSTNFPDDWQGDMLVAYHGSWNRQPPIGYKIVRLHLDGQQITDSSDFITGFLSDNQIFGRPVDLEFNQQGVLFISDDYNGSVYRLN